MAALPLTQKGMDVHLPAVPDSAPRDIFDSRDRPLFVGAPVLRYGEVMAVIDAARAAGVMRIGIVTVER